MKNFAIFASGSGTNAQNIIEYFLPHHRIRCIMVLSNNPKAGVLKRAEKLGVPAVVFDEKQLNETGEVLGILNSNNIDFIVLAGFMRLVPKDIIDEFSGRIVNIHPALLPKYGGKGMYGMHVHRAVLNSGDTESGITIHYVNEKYDEGAVIFQARTQIDPDETPESLALKIHQLEYKHYPPAIESVIK